MVLPRTPRLGAASAVPESLFQKSQVPHERIPRDRWASPGIVDRSRLRDFRERLSKIESVASQKRHMWYVEGTVDPAGVLGFLWNDGPTILLASQDPKPPGLTHEADPQTPAISSRPQVRFEPATSCKVNLL